MIHHPGPAEGLKIWRFPNKNTKYKVFGRRRFCLCFAKIWGAWLGGTCPPAHPFPPALPPLRIELSCSHLLAWQTPKKAEKSRFDYSRLDSVNMSGCAIFHPIIYIIVFFFQKENIFTLSGSHWSLMLTFLFTFLFTWKMAGDLTLCAFIFTIQWLSEFSILQIIQLTWK